MGIHWLVSLWEIVNQNLGTMPLVSTLQCAPFGKGVFTIMLAIGGCTDFQEILKEGYEFYLENATITRNVFRLTATF